MSVILVPRNTHQPQSRLGGVNNDNANRNPAVSETEVDRQAKALPGELIAAITSRPS